MQKLIVATAGLILSTGCYTTKLNAIPSGQSVYEDRQWFLLWGLAALNDPAHAGCQPTAVESEMSLADGLITFGVALVGEAVVYGACKDSATPGSCAAAGSLISASLVSPRTVRWSCSSPRTSLLVEALPAPELAKCLAVGSVRCSVEKDAVEVCSAQREWVLALRCARAGRRCFSMKPQCSVGAACCWSAEAGEMVAPFAGTPNQHPLPPEDRIPQVVPPDQGVPPAQEPPAQPEPPPRKVAIPKA